MLLAYSFEFLPKLRITTWIEFCTLIKAWINSPIFLNFSVSLKFSSKSFNRDSSDSNFALLFTNGVIQESKKSSFSSLFLTKTSISEMPSSVVSFKAWSDEIGVSKISLYIINSAFKFSSLICEISFQLISTASRSFFIFLYWNKALFEVFVNESSSLCVSGTYFLFVIS